MADIVRDLLDQMGIDIKFVPEYRLADMKVAKQDSQVRMTSHLAPAKVTKQYEHQMRAGAQFPPIVIDKANGEIADGNTRRKAAMNAGMDTFPVYLADFGSLVIRKFFAGRINQMGAERLSDTEAKTLALTLLEEGTDPEMISLGLGVSTKSVQEWRYEMEAAHRLGDNTAGLSSNHLVRLNSIKSDPVMTEMALLIQAANMRTGVAGRCVTILNRARSEEEALKIIANWRKEYAPDIRRKKAGVGTKKPSAAACIALAYSNLRKRTITEYIAEINGEVSEETLSQIQWISEFTESLTEALTKVQEAA